MQEALWLCVQGISPYQNAVLVDSSSRVLTLSENLRALLANGAGVDDDGLVRHAAALHVRGKHAFHSDRPWQRQAFAFIALCICTMAVYVICISGCSMDAWCISSHQGVNMARLLGECHIMSYSGSVIWCR